LLVKAFIRHSEPQKSAILTLLKAHYGFVSLKAIIPKASELEKHKEICMVCAALERSVPFVLAVRCIASKNIYYAKKWGFIGVAHNSCA